MTKIRQDHELPESIADWGWKYHHLGIPTKKKLPDEIYLPEFKFYVSGFDTSPFGIEWMKFEKDSPVSILIQHVPHIAFEVKDLDYELANRDLKVLTEPNSPSDGVRVAMIEHNGAPIELIEFNKYKYLTLLRGINVGGNKIIKMTDLRSCFEDMGFTDVSTYIQSGSVLFKSYEKDIPGMTNKIEKVLSERFDYTSRIVVISHQQLKKVINEAPFGFGNDPDKYRYDAIFLKKPLTPDEVMKDLSIKAGVDKVYAGEIVLYFSRLASRAAQSQLKKIIMLPLYQNITVRNWNTTAKLLALMEK